MALVKVEGLVLRTKDLGEADRIVTLMTREKGKMRAVARGARRGRSSLVAISQPFTHGNFMLFLNSRSLHTLSQGELIQPYRHLREDLVRLAYASYFAELADLCLPEEEPNDSAFEATQSAFLQLEKAEVSELLIARWFELQIMNLVGFRPELHACVQCQGTLEVAGGVAGLGFSIPGGGMLCPACASKDGTSKALNGATWQTMRYLLTVPVQRLSAFHPGEGTLLSVSRLLSAYIEFRLEKRINALAFLQSVEGMGKNMA